MFLSDRFVCATKEYSQLDAPVPAPYLRREFHYDGHSAAELTITGLGFYELFINGTKITRGRLSPYISNSSQLIYYDCYDIRPYLVKGCNAIGVLLGNGMQNCFGGFVWDFDKTPFRTAPLLALALELGGKLVLEADEQFLAHPSPIREDDLRLGEQYDARYELPGWNLPGYDASGWTPAIPMPSPKGEKRLNQARPIRVWKELSPVNIWQEDDAYIYDFGENLAGVVRLTVDGQPGQEIRMAFGEKLVDGKFHWENISFIRPEYANMRRYWQEDVYICKGQRAETYTPSFTYHGFRYVQVKGLIPGQATNQLLRYLVFNTEMGQNGDFHCSDFILNRIQEMTCNSTVSNFHHFPTDCPHREKNGWTFDAAISTEQTLMNWDEEENYRQWQHNVCAAQDDLGALPGIVPTWGWGFHWGNGPAWDSVLINIPYQLLRYRGDQQTVRDSAAAFVKYFNYLDTRKDERGLIEFGLGDWVDPSGSANYESGVRAPLIVTASCYAMENARQAAQALEAVGMSAEAGLCRDFCERMKAAIRTHLIDWNTFTVHGNCQGAQAVGIFYGVMTEDEQKKATDVLVDMIHQDNDHIACGILGSRVIFHVLTKFGYGDLAYKMITQPDAPSYGYWVNKGLSTLEEHMAEDASQNHHFFGFISAWFLKDICGIEYNESLSDEKTVCFRPHFLTALDHAEGWFCTPEGRLSSRFVRVNNGISLTLEVPAGIRAICSLSEGWTDALGRTEFTVASGEYQLVKMHDE